ncbi:MAG: U32 family peptidase [Bacillota bacterium]|nr:U32 family peptidase [Bacillota bacterium]
MRYRFEKASQIFDYNKEDIIILPLKEWIPGAWAEIPAMIYAEDEELIKKELLEKNVTDVVCENIGAIQIAKELGLTAHGGMFLNVLNSEAANMYKSLGLKDVTLSMELSFNEMKHFKADIKCGAVIYGYLPLMKFRACPGDCKTCKGQSELIDRMGESFTLICRNKKYSELLNCVPLYVADKQIPKLDFVTLYFTKETKEEAAEIRNLVQSGNEYFGRRTNGLYFRELL